MATATMKFEERLELLNALRDFFFEYGGLSDEEALNAKRFGEMIRKVGLESSRFDGLIVDASWDEAEMKRIIGMHLQANRIRNHKL